MTVEATASVPEEASGSQRLAVLPAMAMFVLVVDTSLMNLSISSVVRDLNSSCSSRIALGGTMIALRSTCRWCSSTTRWRRGRGCARGRRAVITNTQQLAGQPQATQNEIVRINSDSRHIALHVAMLIPILAGVVGFLNAFRMLRQPDPAPCAHAEGLALG